MSNGLSENSRNYLFYAYENYGTSGFSKEDIEPASLRRSASCLVSAGYLKKHRTGDKTYTITAKGLRYYRLMRHRGQE